MYILHSMIKYNTHLCGRVKTLNNYGNNNIFNQTKTHQRYHNIITKTTLFRNLSDVRYNIIIYCIHFNSNSISWIHQQEQRRTAQYVMYKLYYNMNLLNIIKHHNIIFLNLITRTLQCF